VAAGGRPVPCERPRGPCGCSRPRGCTRSSSCRDRPAAPAPYVGDTAADWWRRGGKCSYIVREMHFNAPYIYGQGPIRVAARRIAMRSAITALTSLGIPADRRPPAASQSGPGKRGREGLEPSRPGSRS
jgi:hypothetical protein